MEYTNKFIGDRKIISFKEDESKTYLGNPRVEVEYENGDKEIYPIIVLDRIVSDESIDGNALADLRVNPVVSEAIAILAEAELTKDEILYFFIQRLSDTLVRNEEKAMEKFFGKPMHKTTLRDINEVIK